MSGMLERARGATQQLTGAAVAQVDVVRGGIADQVDAVRGGIADQVDAVRSGIADLDVGAIGAEKVQQLLSAMDAAAPFVTEAGYEFVQAFVELGLPPRLVVRTRRVRQITDEEEAALRERAADSKVGSVVLRTFLSVAALQHTLSSQSFAAAEIEFELTTLPRARLYFEHRPRPT